MPLSCLDYLNIDTSQLRVGDTFNTVNGHSICTKYVIKKETTQQMNKPQKQANRHSRLVDNQFRLHFDTNNLRVNVHKLNPTDTISITSKLHGTSFIVANILTNKPKTVLDTIAGWFGINVASTIYDIIWSSRKVIKNQYISPNAQHYYDADIWGIVASELKSIIPKGITLYGEIVGFMPSGAAIQRCSEGSFDYGCPEFTHKSYIYRITHTDPDGNVIEFSWSQIIDFCAKYGLNTPPLHFYGKAKDMYPTLDTTCHWNENFLDVLEQQFMQNQDCPMCAHKVPFEGIVVSRETLYDRESFKLKTFRFLNKAETEMLDAGISDIETEQSIDNEGEI